MDTVSLRAHFDGRKILLDDPFNLEPDTKLIVTVLPKDIDKERKDWMRLSENCLEKAYGNDEPEYSSKLIKEANPDYDGR